jgi:hypothetical protein
MKSKTKKQCVHCGKEFMGSKRKQFCDQRCYYRWLNTPEGHECNEQWRKEKHRQDEILRRKVWAAVDDAVAKGIIKIPTA